MIWGTDVNVQEAKKKFRDFLENFIDDIPEEGEESSIADQSEPYYMQRLEEVCTLHHHYIREWCNHSLRQPQYPVMCVTK